MSTFKGIVKEFPGIRIDYFRTVPGHPAPLACFLSHVHSDHLVGLPSFKMPFIYCSPATREILLRLEKYPHRMNFAKGILETRKQTYRHLSGLLKTIPLDTPTSILLPPGNVIQVTTLDANHCVGAVMFLIQDSNGTAILYTGDVRSEPWLVNSLVQNPILVPFTLGSRRLDCLYLDTTFATKENIHESFVSKAEGLKELLEQVERYPKDVLFYLHSWTFGYENVWVALSAALNSKIHVDPYRWGLYKSLGKVAGTGMPQPREAAALCGFKCGNHHNEGCLTPNHEHVRIHSCEHGAGCPIIEKRKDVVVITPIVSRSRDGIEVAETGAGGGYGDLRQTHELEVGDMRTVEALRMLLKSELKESESLQKILDLVTNALNKENGRIRFNPDDLPDADSTHDVPLEKVTQILQSALEDRAKDENCLSSLHGKPELPQSIHFPYSRHSSYSELCELVAAFRPKDIHACTVDESNWTPQVSMRSLFGKFCSDDVFAQDEVLLEGLRERQRAQQRDKVRSNSSDSQFTDDSESQTSQIEPSKRPTVLDGAASGPLAVQAEIDTQVTESAPSSPRRDVPLENSQTKRKHGDGPDGSHAKSIERWAYDCAAGLNGMDWHAFGGLTSTRVKQQSPEL